jgi:EmrB/QacA subfamily drug resistance transporter
MKQSPKIPNSGKVNATDTTMKPAQESPRRWLIMTLIFIGAFMPPLDSSIVNITLKDIQQFFGVGISTVEWIVTAYLLTASSLLLSAGRLADIKGHKKIYISGFTIFTIASGLCGLSGSISQLITFRIIQAIGGTMLLATGPAIITDTFPPNERGKAFGVLGLSIAIGLTTGPILGGIIVHLLNWRWIFFVNLPVGVLVTALASKILKEGKINTEKRFDFPGAAVGFLALLSLLVVLNLGKDWGWGSFTSMGFAVVTVLLIALFIYIESTVDEPMLDLSLFSSRLFSAANLSALINYLAIFNIVFLIPYYMRDVYGQTQLQTGMLLTAIPLTTGIVGPISGILSDKIGSRLLATFGISLLAVSQFGLSTTSPSSGILPVAIFLGLLGIGSGMFQSPNSSAIMSAVPRNRLGIASGMQATMRNVGMVLGIALAGAIVTTLAPLGSHDKNFADAIHMAFLAGGFVTVIGVVSSLVRGVDQR